MRKRFLTIVSALILLLALSACGKSKEATNVDTMIAGIDMSAVVQNRDAIQEASDAYDALTDEQKEEVEGYSAISSALNIIAVQDMTDALKVVQAPTQSQVDELETAYSALSEDEKTQVTGYEDAIALRDCEIKAIQAVNQLSKFLKDSSSLELYNVYIKMDVETMPGDPVVIKYSATNGFGGRIDNTACLDINDSGEDSILNLSLLTGKGFESGQTINYTYYIQAPEAEIEIDCDRITNNRDRVDKTGVIG